MKEFIKFLKDMGLAGVTVFLIRGLRGLIFLPILTKTLGAEGYGIWSQIMVTISLLMPLSLMQLEYAMTRFLTPEKDIKKISTGVSSIFIMIIFSSLILSILIYVFSDFIAMAVFGGLKAIEFVKLTAILLFITAMSQIVIQYFISFRKVEKYSVLITLQTFGEISLVYLLIVFGFGLIGAIYALLLVRSIIFSIGLYIIKLDIGISKPNLRMLKLFLTFSLPLYPFTLCWWIINSADRYVISYMLGIKAVGVYSAAYTIGSLISLFYAPISLTFLPAITYLYENNKQRDLKIHLKYTFKIFLMAAIPSVFVLSILSKPIIKILTSSEFIGGYVIIPIVALGTLFFCIGNIVSDILILLKKVKFISIVFSLSAILNLIMNIILVPIIGIIGAAISTLVTFVTHTLILSINCYKYFSFNLDYKFISKSIIASFIMIFIMWIIPLNYYNNNIVINTLIHIVIGIITYILVLITLKGITKEECNYLITQLLKVKR